MGIKFCFHEKDKASAETLMSAFGHGALYKIKDKRAYSWQFGSKIAKTKFLSLIDGHIRTEYKLNQIRTNAASFLPPNFQQKIDTSPILNSWWLAGFTDADGYFYIQIVADETRSDRIRIQLKFSLKDRTILEQLAEAFGSTIGTRKHPSGSITFYWSSSNTPNAYKVHNYFHQFSLQSKKWLEFMYWRKALRIVKAKLHKTDEGFRRIECYKMKMSKLKM